MEPQRAAGTSVDEEALQRLNDQIVQKTIADDPLLSFLSKQWRGLVGIAVVAVLGYLAVNAYQGALLDNRQAAADLFADVRASFASLQSNVAVVGAEKDETKRAELQKKLDEERHTFDQKLRALADSVSPYREIAAVYRTLGDLSADANAVGLETALVEWQNLGPDSAERFVAESKALLAARIMLDRPGKRAEGIAQLRALVENGRSVEVSAAAAIAAVAENDDERAAAIDLIEKLSAREPWAVDLLKDAKARLTTK